MCITAERGASTAPMGRAPDTQAVRSKTADMRRFATTVGPLFGGNPTEWKLDFQERPMCS